jgi:hypothetical protein
MQDRVKRSAAAAERGQTLSSARGRRNSRWETQRLLHVVADRQRWHAALTEARARASGQDSNLSATGRAA